jgi:acetyl esterase/lipase
MMDPMKERTTAHSANAGVSAKAYRLRKPDTDADSRATISQYAFATLSMLVALSCMGANQVDDSSSRPSSSQTAQKQNDRTQAAHLRADDDIGNLLSHRAFAGFARLTLPWDDRVYDETMPISDMSRLLPYHTHVNPEIVVSGLNRMIDDVAEGKTVFYDIYTEAEKQTDASRKNTGLFFFRGKPGATFAVIAPGGAFTHVASVHEGFPYAVEINNRGYNAFVLKYRVGDAGTPATKDLAAALSFIFRNADSLGVTTKGYSLWGSSAGARMAAAVGSHGTQRFGGPDLPKPATVVMIYTAHSDFGSSEPPTFVAVGELDEIAPPSTMEKRVALLRKAGTEVEYHKYPRVAHGFGLGTDTSAEGWAAEAIHFWERQINSRSDR